MCKCLIICFVFYNNIFRVKFFYYDVVLNMMIYLKYEWGYVLWIVFMDLVEYIWSLILKLGVYVFM